MGVAGGHGRVVKYYYILLCTFLYRKFVRKWRLLKRNRIICPEVTVNKQFLPGKNLPGKIEIVCEIA